MKTEDRNLNLEWQRARACDESAEWLVRLNSEDVSDAVYADYAHWLAESPEHKDACDEMLALWEDLARVRELPLPPSTNLRDKRSRRHFLWLGGSLAASFIVAAFLLLMPSSVRYQTEHGKTSTVSLDDGSTLRLNTETELLVDLNETERSIELLQGQAFFQVARDTTRPFIVHTRYGKARAVGTAFEVNTLNERLEITVVEGLVEVSTPQNKRDQISSDEQVWVNRESITHRVVDAEAVTAWQDGRLVYDGVTLGELVSDLNRYLPRKMTVADSQLASTRVSAVLQLEDQELMLKALSLSFPLTWNAVSDNLIIIQTKRSS